MVKVLAVRYYEPGKPLRLEQVELPTLGDNDVLIEVKAAGVCHSELHMIRGRLPPTPIPAILGHEMSGVIADKGKGVSKFGIGDPVGVDYIWSCGTCRCCLVGRENLCDNPRVMGFLNAAGSWAEKAVVPVRHVHRLPSNLDFPEGAIMNCAVMTAYHAMKSAQVSAGDSVLVYGLGGLGTTAVQWARIFGATEIIGVDLEEGKLNLATRMGATAVVNPKDGDPVKQIRDMTDGGVDIGFEFIGLPTTITNMVRCVRKSGKAVLVGMCFDPLPLSPVSDLMFGEIQLLSVTDHVKAEIAQVVKFIEDGRLDLSQSVSHKFRLQDANEAVRVLSERIGNPVRVVLEP
jgi:2-desacetyl-2-hydroxyethyl bacteriochlorophyllide A dehydrogenase